MKSTLNLRQHKKILFLLTSQTSTYTVKGQKVGVELVQELSKREFLQKVQINPLIGAIGFETFSGSIKQAEHDAWLIRVVEYAIEKGLSSQNLVIVLDNAPSHRGIEDRPVYSQLTALGTKLLRLGPYSAPLNPIELIWNTIKSFIKRKVAGSLDLLTTIPEGYTQKSWRFNLMRDWAELAFQTVNRVQVFRTTMHCRA